MIARIGADAWSQLSRGDREPTKTEQEAIDVCLAAQAGSGEGRPLTLDWPVGPLPQVSLAVRVQGEPPCKWEDGRVALDKTHPVLVRYLGEPFSIGSTGVTWIWDSTSLDPGKIGWFAESNEIVVNGAAGGGRPAAENCERVWWQYFHELGHLFYDVGQEAIRFDFGQWIWEAHSLIAESFARTEMREDPSWGTSPLFIYDIQANMGWEKVNGVARDGAKYGDNIGSFGRTTVNSAATSALRLMAEVLSYDTGLDFLRRVNAGILAEYQASRNATISVEEYKGILSKAAQGRTIDGRPPGDWLFAQPVANNKGSPGLYLTIQPRRPLYAEGFSELAFTMAAYERQSITGRDERQEAPLGDLDVSVSVVDVSSQVRTQAVFRTRASGDVEARAPLLRGLAPGAYLLKAQAVARGQTLEASNVFLIGRDTLNLDWALNDFLLVVPLNADGTALRPEVVAQLQVTGAERQETTLPGVLALKAKPGASMELTLGSFRMVISKPLAARVIPLRVP